jgi:hypothetical protein
VAPEKSLLAVVHVGDVLKACLSWLSGDDVLAEIVRRADKRLDSPFGLACLLGLSGPELARFVAILSGETIGPSPATEARKQIGGSIHTNQRIWDSVAQAKADVLRGCEGLARFHRNLHQSTNRFVSLNEHLSDGRGEYQPHWRSDDPQYFSAITQLSVRTRADCMAIICHALAKNLPAGQVIAAVRNDVVIEVANSASKDTDALETRISEAVRVAFGSEFPLRLSVAVSNSWQTALDTLLPAAQPLPEYVRLTHGMGGATYIPPGTIIPVKLLGSETEIRRWIAEGLAIQSDPPPLPEKLFD